MIDRKVTQPGTITHLFWTGGWDSTFRLLQLLLDEQKAVQTYYLLDSSRASCPKEIETILTIKKRLHTDYPHTQQLLLPTQFHEIASIPPNPEITQAFHEILKKKHLGTQYEFLARFCAERGLKDVELSIVDDGAFHLFIPDLNGTNGTTPAAENEALSSDLQKIFRFFTFPLIHRSKTEIQRIAEQRGWMDFMRLTWFCHNPILGKFPCGQCRPCQIALEEGMGWRIPALIRAKNKLAGARPFSSFLAKKKALIRVGHFGNRI
jgi:Predicted PP-loop superfamily ATPase